MRYHLRTISLVWLAATGCAGTPEGQRGASALNGGKEQAEAEHRVSKARADAGPERPEQDEVGPQNKGDDGKSPAKGDPTSGSAGSTAKAPANASAAAAAGSSAPSAPMMTPSMQMPPMASAATTPTVSTEISKVAFTKIMDSREASVPVLIYSGGYASLNTNLITEPIDIAYDVVEHPDAWPWWRQGADRVELLQDGAWMGVHYAYETRSLPANTRFNGLFERYIENIAASVGGNVHRYRYNFSDDGTFEFCDASEVIVVATGTIKYENMPKKGHYQIEGYVIKLEYDDGSPDLKMPFFFDPARPTRFWIRSAFYENTKDQTLPVCEKP